jgi:hypothetical protein
MRNPFFLSLRDERMLTRGYYEDLGDMARFNPQLADLYKGRPADWFRNWATHRTGGFPSHDLLPSRRVIYKGEVMTTNRWGMRDRDYEKAKPQGTYRFALLGSSHAMGGGVRDEETFENVTEDRLNREVSPRTGVRYEILNFSVGGWGPVASLTELQDRVFDFEPDAVIFTGVNELTWVVKEMTEDAMGLVDIPYQELHEIARPAGVTEGMAQNVISEKLRPYAEELLTWVYNEVSRECRARDVVAVAAFIPHATIDAPRHVEEAAAQVEIAREAGFLVIDMVDVYDSLPELEAVWLAEWDRHPNAKGNSMLADSLYAGLVRELKIEVHPETSPGGD